MLREDGLVARRARRRVRTTDSAHAHPVAPHVVARGFAVADQPGLDRTWVSDFTYIPTREGWLFLAVVLDLASRRVVGWAVRETMEAELVLAALHMALAARRPAPGLVHHADRGSQGGFNRSSHHLPEGGCDDNTGGTEALAFGSVGPRQAALAWSPAGRTA